MARRGQEKLSASLVRELRSGLPRVRMSWDCSVLSSLSTVELITWQYSTSSVSVNPFRKTLEDPNWTYDENDHI